MHLKISCAKWQPFCLSHKTTVYLVCQQWMYYCFALIEPSVCLFPQLLGQIDMDTREWSDGVLTFAARQVIKEPIGES